MGALRSARTPPSPRPSSPLFPGVFHVGRRQRTCAGRSDAAAGANDDDCPGDVGDARAVSRRPRRLCARSKRDCLGCLLQSAGSPRAAWCSCTRGDWFLAAMCFGVANVGFTASLTFTIPPSPHRARGRDRSRVYGRLCPRVSGRRCPACAERGVDSVAGDVRPARCGPGVAVVLRERRALVVRVLDSPLPARSRADGARPAALNRPPP